VTETLDEPLIADAVAGDRVALEKLLLLHHGRLLAGVCGRIPRRLRQTMTPEDLCQETYVIAVAEIGSFRGKARRVFFHWLRSIVANQLTDAIRSGQAAKRTAGQSGGSAHASWATVLEFVQVNGPDPGQSTASREARAAVQEALNGLKQDYGQALTLRYMDGLSVGETARRMRRSGHAVKMICHRALRQMRAAMSNTGYDQL